MMYTDMRVMTWRRVAKSVQALAAHALLFSFVLLFVLKLDRSVRYPWTYVVDLKILFLPILAFEIAILVDNIRMCRALMPGDDESLTDDAIWATLPHFWVAISMVFCIAATTFTLLKLCELRNALPSLFARSGIIQLFMGVLT